MLNLSKSEIARETRRQNILIDLLSRRSEQDIRRVISGFVSSSMEHFQSNGTAVPRFLFEDQKNNFIKVFNRLYRRAIRTSSKRQFDSFSKSRNHNLEIKQDDDSFLRLSLDWINENALRQALLVSETTAKEIQDELSRSIQEGLSIGETVKFINQKVGGQIARRRARVISVTETHNAFSFANLESTKTIADDLGLDLKKVWATAEDDRVRGAHLAADGQVRDIDSPFDVGGEQLNRPGDPSGSASNVINCRCIITFSS